MKIEVLGQVVEVEFVGNPIADKQAVILAEMHVVKTDINRAVDAHEFEEADALREHWNMLHKHMMELDKLINL